MTSGWKIFSRAAASRFNIATFQASSAASTAFSAGLAARAGGTASTKANADTLNSRTSLRMGPPWMGGETSQNAPRAQRVF